MVQLTIYVSDAATVYSVGFRYTVIERADTEDGVYSVIGSVALNASTTSYSYTDATGTADHWYRSRYSDLIHTDPSYPDLVSSYSSPVKGEEAALFHNVTYPSEVSLGTEDQTKVNKLRILIGDAVEIRRMLHGQFEECQNCPDDDVHCDKHTVELDQKGWPLYISLSDVEKTSSRDPYVDGYRYLTFSGTIGPDTTLDIYYETF